MKKFYEGCLNYLVIIIIIKIIMIIIINSAIPYFMLQSHYPMPSFSNSRFFYTDIPFPKVLIPRMSIGNSNLIKLYKILLHSSLIYSFLPSPSNPSSSCNLDSPLRTYGIFQALINDAKHNHYTPLLISRIHENDPKETIPYRGLSDLFYHDSC